MKFFVTGVGGQLGHDVMNELAKRGHTGVGSDMAAAYSGVADGSAVTTMPYVQLDITDAAAVEKAISEVNPDAVIHCAAFTAVDKAEEAFEENKDLDATLVASSTKYYKTVVPMYGMSYSVEVTPQEYLNYGDAQILGTLTTYYRMEVSTISE